MKLHEYQAKQLFASAGIPIQRGIVAETPDAARAAYRQLAGGKDGAKLNIKAQIHAGGRGKAGGVKAVLTADEAASVAAELLGKRLVTKQTGPEGLPVKAVWVDERVEGGRELYLAVTLDRFKSQPVVLASAMGGMDIEEVAEKNPGAIVREGYDLLEGIATAQVERIVKVFGLSGAQAAACGEIVRSLCKLYEVSDAVLIEINPLVIMAKGDIIALDAKFVVDDNSLFRHPDLAAMRDPSQEDPNEYKASQIGISYVGLSGNIGCLVNGAGLAMATNDIIKLSGGEPANFLDVGGGANVDQVTNAFSIILSDKKVKAILVNIFGGIMRCDWIATGLLKATEQLKVKVPIVVRLQGTNVQEGRKLLRDAKHLNLISVDELADAARKVVEVAGKA